MIQGVSELSQTQCLKKQKKKCNGLKSDCFTSLKIWWILQFVLVWRRSVALPVATSTVITTTCRMRYLTSCNSPPQWYKGITSYIHNTKGLITILNHILKKIHYYLKIVNICYLIILKCMAEKFEKMKEKGEKGNGHFKLKSIQTSQQKLWLVRWFHLFPSTQGCCLPQPKIWLILVLSIYFVLM